MNTIPSSLVRFEDQLEEAIRQRARRPRRVVVRTALVAAGAAAVSLGVLSLLPASGPSVVDRAAAALTRSDGTILHVVLVGSFKGGHMSRLETWQESTPPYAQREIATVDGQRIESASTGDMVQLYDPATNTVYVGSRPPKSVGPEDGSAKEGQNASGTKAPPPGRALDAGVDAYRFKVLTLLQSGKAHETGHVDVVGRDAIRIASADGSFEITVDATTYEPIEWRVDEGGQTALARFPTYEHLPGTSANQALLSIADQHPGATVDTSQGDYLAALQRLAPEKAAK